MEQTSWKVTLGAAFLAVIVSVVLVTQTTSAAFTGSTSTPKNNWTSGHVTLDDNDQGAAMFTVSKVKPGDSGERCITVTNNSTVANRTKVYTANVKESGSPTGLGSVMNVTLDIGTAASASSTFGSCSGFVKESNVFDASGYTATRIHQYANGAGNWVHDGKSPQSRTYRFRWVLPETVGNEVANGYAQINFVWESRSI